MSKASLGRIGEPFQAITKQMAQDWYRRHHITTTGYLLAIKGILRPPGVALVIKNVLEFCREWGITKSAFYRAVNSLKGSGEIDWEATEGLVLKSPAGESAGFPPPETHPDSETLSCEPKSTSQLEPYLANETVSREQHSLPQLERCPANGTASLHRNYVPPAQQCPTSGTVSHERNSQSRERNSQSHERNLQSHERDSDIYIDRARAQIYSNLVESLSDSERENFEEFVRNEWRKLKSEEIVSLERFLGRQKDFDIWYQKFLKSPAGRAAKRRAIAMRYDWRNDPRFDDWIWKSWNGGYPWSQEDEAEKEERYAFYCWAQDTDGYAGVCH